MKRARCFEPVKIVKFRVPRIIIMMFREKKKFILKSKIKAPGTTGHWLSTALTGHLVKIALNSS